MPYADFNYVAVAKAMEGELKLELGIELINIGTSGGCLVKCGG